MAATRHRPEVGEVVAGVEDLVERDARASARGVRTSSSLFAAPWCNSTMPSSRARRSSAGELRGWSAARRDSRALRELRREPIAHVELFDLALLAG